MFYQSEISVGYQTDVVDQKSVKANKSANPCSYSYGRLSLIFSL